MSVLKAIRQQLGLSATPANNYVWRAIDDGAARLSRGNANAETSDPLVVGADNLLTVLASPATGNRTKLLATMEKFADEFAKSTFATYTTPGYQKLPSGLILQWGYQTSIATLATTSPTFPIAFPTGCLWAGAVSGTSVGVAGSIAFGTTALNTTSATFQNHSGTTSNVFWIALGY